MKRNEIFVDQGRMYALTVDKEGQYYLEVVCGGFAMENMILPLNAEEMEKYNSRGKLFLDDLAWDVCKNKNKFTGRFI